MALKSYQTALALDTLYEVRKAKISADEQRGPNLWINSGTVDVYGSNSATQPGALANMTLSTENTEVSGLVQFTAIPRYIAIVQNTGTTTELVASGVDVVSRGAIS